MRGAPSCGRALPLYPGPLLWIPRGKEKTVEAIKEFWTKHRGASIALVIAALAAAIAGWYFLYWVKSPSYSLNLIREAVQNHDVETFHRHVDTKTLYGQLYDDVVGYSLEKEGMNNPLAAGFAAALKPAVVEALIEKTDEAIARDETLTGEDKDNPTGHIIDQTGAAKSTFKGISDVVTMDDKAIVSLTFHDGDLGRDFLIKVNMERLPDSTWRAVTLADFPDYLAAYDGAKADKLKALNADIAKSIADIAVIEDMGAPALVTQNGSHILHVPFTLTNKTAGDTLQGVTIRSEITNGEGKVLYEGRDNVTVNVAPGQGVSMGYGHPVNPRIEAEKEILDTGGENVRVTLTLTSVTTDKGTTAMLDKLPE